MFVSKAKGQQKTRARERGQATHLISCAGQRVVKGERGGRERVVIGSACKWLRKHSMDTVRLSDRHVCLYSLHMYLSHLSGEFIKDTILFN